MIIKHAILFLFITCCMIGGEKSPVVHTVDDTLGEKERASYCKFSDAREQTAYSLFLHNEKKQVAEIGADESVAYRLVGHHGPAVENSHMALRIYYNDSGAIDLYSKSGKMMELRKYLWYPTEKQQMEEGAGCDEYFVGKTVGFGGIALWDGENEIRPVATSGRVARVGKTKQGSFCEVINRGVQMNGKNYDISIRIDVFNDNRYARVTATSLTGEKVRFATGINYHQGEEMSMGDGWMGVWGIHPSDVSKNPGPIGAGMLFKKSEFTNIVKTPNTLLITTKKPVRKVSTLIIGASAKDDKLCDKESFWNEISIRSYNDMLK